MNYEHTSKLHRLRTLHLFAGAGGGILADILLGHQPVCAVEIEPYCQQVLHARQKDGFLPWFPIFDDVKTFDGKPWRGLVEVVAGGFPCVDISVAGKGAGIEGERSGLWGEMARIICEIRPRFVFVENSPALVVRGLGRVLGDLAEMGYDARWGVLGCGDAGGMHQRNRIWIIAFANDNGERIERFIPKAVCRQSGFSWCKDVRRIEDFFLRPDLYPAPLCRSYDGMAGEMDAIKAIGNGQVPICAAMAWRILSEGII